MCGFVETRSATAKTYSSLAPITKSAIRLSRILVGRAITFIGSNGVGKTLYRQALDSDHGVTVRPELGGKNPAIVLKDADRELALTQTINGAMMSSGQKCTATSRAFVHRAVCAEFVDTLTQRVGKRHLGDPQAATTILGPLASAAQRDSVISSSQLSSRD